MKELGNKLWNWMEKIAKAVVFWLFGLFHKEITEEQWQKFMQFVKFCFVGLSNFMISYITYAVFVAIGCNYHVGNIMGFLISVLNSYYWNNKYVFKTEDGEHRSWWKALLKTYLSYAFSGLFLTEILLYVEITIIGLPSLLGPIINLFITTPINFVINKLWAFKGEKNAETEKIPER